MMLDWSQIRFGSSPVITVEGKGQGGKKIVTLPMGPKLKTLMQRLYKEAGKPKAGRVFPELKDWASRHYLDEIKKAAPTLRQKGEGWHTFRRTFGSLLVQRGAPIAQVSKLMRHSSVKVTMDHYTHLLPEHGREYLDLL